MPLTDGEQYTAFLLLISERSSLRQVVEGTHASDGTMLNPPQIPASAQAAATRATTALKDLGMDPGRVDSVTPGLAFLFDPAGRNNITTSQARVAGALGLPYGGNCPTRPTESAIFNGIRSQLP
jgi:hypothetical protein